MALGVELALGEDAEIGALGEVLAEQADARLVEFYFDQVALPLAEHPPLLDFGGRASMVVIASRQTGERGMA